jgi:hypothetical protein
MAELRGEMLDEPLEILLTAWSGELVNHRGTHYLIKNARFAPSPVCGTGSDVQPRLSPRLSRERDAGMPPAARG